MNYYERHLGDYARDTGHLSLLEHGVYTLLLDRYYASESPIPEADVYRVARARSKDERAAVDAVLAEFFTLEDGFFRQKRIDAEIERYLEKEPQREKKKADAADRQRRARERRIKLFEQLRQRGIVPSIKTPTTELERLLEEHDKRDISPQHHASVTRDNTLTHTPVTSHQSPIKTKGNQAATAGLDPAAAAAAAPPSPDPIQSRSLELVAMLRQRGAAIAAGNPHSRRWAEIGVTDAQALSALETAEQRRSETGSVQPVNAGLLNAIIDDALNPKHSRPAGRRSIHDERSETIAALTGRRNHEQHESGTVIDITPTTVAGGMD